ncbi:uncharacterized protein JCM15063_003876 [Sporobolomyces koalae]|uniref:uncharacterized protein n=1 Tax=Sporobolomyces koalae TaxID=500713 RepID=UPI00316ED40F
MATSGPSPLLQPSPNLSTWGCHSPGGNSVRELLQERNRHSPLPPASPALSDSGFSTFVDSPGTIHSPIFNFAAHHQFDDEPFTPEATQRDQFDELASPSPPRLGISTHPDDLAPPRIASPPLPASPSTNTENFSDYSPSPSIASVRMAKVAVIPHRRNLRQLPHDASRLSAASSALSESIAEDDLDSNDDGDGDNEQFQDSTREEWTRDALERSSCVDDLPRDLAKLLASNSRVSAAQNHEGSRTIAPGESAKDSRLEPPHITVAPLKIVKSDSQQSVLSDESWKDDLDAVVKHLESDPNLKPDADAMQRMKSILGPKLKLVSKAPWDDLGDDEPLAGALPTAQQAASRSTRKTSEPLKRNAPSPLPAVTTSSKAAKDRKENVKPSKSRTRSFSALTSRRHNTADEAKEREDALQGLGLGLSQVSAVPDSPSKRSLKGLVKSYSGLPSSDSYHDLTGRPKTSLDLATRKQAISSPTVTIVSERQRVEAAHLRKSGRVPPPVTFDLVTSNNVPRSAPPTVSTFARSESHSSLHVRQPAPVVAALPDASNPCTPNALVPASPSPTSPDTARGSYFTAVPGGSSQSPSAFGHHLISLEEARQRESENRRARLNGHDSSNSLASKARTRESTLESVATRKTSSTTPPVSQSGYSSPATTIASLPTPRSLKPKKSGFLKRMMGGVDKHERFDTPLPVPPPHDISSRNVQQEQARPIIASSASVPSLESISAPNSLSRATGLKAAIPLASPANPASASRVAFASTPAPDPNQRLRKGFAPSLSLRPVSMAFSAGLPSDFLASLAAAEHAHARALPTIPDGDLVSPNAPSFKSVASNASTSVFDEAGSAPSGLPLTPLTPSFPPSISSSPTDEADAMSVKYAALQAEYRKAKTIWQSLQWELESQIRSLQIELQKTKEETANVEASTEFSDSDKCSTCGVSKATIAAAPASVIQRPRFKGQGGSGALFGSASGPNA